MKRVNLQRTINLTLLLARKLGIKYAVNHLLSEASDILELRHAYGRPRYVQIESTTHCNSKCVMCWRVQNKKKPRHMRFSEFKRMMLKLPYCRAVWLQGHLGEPLLNPDVLRMINFCKERKIQISLVTNASLLSEDMSRKLILGGVSYIGFSIDSANEKTFNQIRRGMNFAAIKKNIKRFVELKGKLGSKTLITEMWTIVSDQNICSIRELLNLAKSLGVTNVLLRPLAENSYSPLRRVPKERLGILLKHKAYGESLGLRVRLFFPDLPPISNRKRAECHSLWSGIFVTVDGFVFPCCTFPYERYPNLNAGNIFREDFNRIWNSERYKYMRMKVSKDSSVYCTKCLWSGLAY